MNFNKPAFYPFANTKVSKDVASARKNKCNLFKIHFTSFLSHCPALS